MSPTIEAISDIESRESGQTPTGPLWWPPPPALIYVGPGLRFYPTCYKLPVVLAYVTNVCMMCQTSLVLNGYMMCTCVCCYYDGLKYDESHCNFFVFLDIKSIIQDYLSVV